MADWLGWPCPVRSALKRTAVQDFNYFSIIFYYNISNTYQKIGDLFFPFHISGLVSMGAMGVLAPTILREKIILSPVGKNVREMEKFHYYSAPTISKFYQGPCIMIPKFKE